jgi:hypothetical protein
MNQHRRERARNHNMPVQDPRLNITSFVQWGCVLCVWAHGTDIRAYQGIHGSA